MILNVGTSLVEAIKTKFDTENQEQYSQVTSFIDNKFGKTKQGGFRDSDVSKTLADPEVPQNIKEGLFAGLLSLIQRTRAQTDSDGTVLNTGE